MTYLLPLTYLGNIQYYSHLIFNPCIVESKAHYVKQTFANRVQILTAQGKLDLSIPIEKPKGKTTLDQINISYQTPWQTLHWRTIASAYSSSPFFEYYQDELLPFFQNKTIKLIDFNLGIQKALLSCLEYENINFEVSNTYVHNLNPETIDLRDVIHPKKNCLSLHKIMKEEYQQVFHNKFEFLPNLSLIDLLFNLGPESRIYLKTLNTNLNKYYYGNT